MNRVQIELLKMKLNSVWVTWITWIEYINTVDFQRWFESSREEENVCFIICKCDFSSLCIGYGSFAAFLLIFLVNSVQSCIYSCLVRICSCSHSIRQYSSVCPLLENSLSLFESSSTVLFIAYDWLMTLVAMVRNSFHTYRLRQIFVWQNAALSWLQFTMIWLAFSDARNAHKHILRSLRSGTWA